MNKPGSLETKLNELIAKLEGIKPEEVTVEYIHKRREEMAAEEVFRDAIHVPTGLTVFNRNFINRLCW